MAYIAKHRFAPISASKARLVLDMIRGKPLADALTICRFSRKRAAHLIGKVLKSAQANAQDRGEEALGALMVAKAWADEGGQQRKFRPGPRGIANAVLSRKSHINVELEAAGAAKDEGEA